jgi:purine nucleoside permease
MQAAEAAELARKAFASEKSDCIASQQQSDHLVMLAAYRGWHQAVVKGGPRLAREYTKRHCLSFSTLQMLRDMRNQFAAMLADVKCALVATYLLISSIGTISSHACASPSALLTCLMHSHNKIWAARTA